MTVADDPKAERARARELYESFVRVFLEYYLPQALGGDEAKEWVKLFDSDPAAAEDHAALCNVRRAVRSARIAFIETMKPTRHRSFSSGVGMLHAPACGTFLAGLDKLTENEELVNCPACLKIGKEP